MEDERMGRNGTEWGRWLLAWASVVMFAASCGGDGGSGEGRDAGPETCEPACRDGYVCIDGRCAEACNPPCAAGERCVGEGRCEPVGDGSTGTDGSMSDDASTGIDGGTPGDGAVEAGSDADPGMGMDGGMEGGGGTDAGSDAATDAATDAASGMGEGGTSMPPPSCPAGQVACGDTCRAPTLPAAGSSFEVWSKTDRTGFYDTYSDLAFDPCSGTFGVVVSQEVSGPATNREVHFYAVPVDGSDTTRVRVTFAPGNAHVPRAVFARDRFVLVWTDPRHDPTPDTCEPRCHREVYLAAYGADGTETVAEQRLTTVTDANHRTADLAVVYHPELDRLLVVWRRIGDGDGQPDTLRALVVDREGTIVVDPFVLATAGAQGTPVYPNPKVEGDHWTVFYARKRSAFRDKLAVRTVAADGTLGTATLLDEPRMSELPFAAVRRSDGAWSTLTREYWDGNENYLRRWSADWSTSARVVTPAYLYQRGTLGYDGTAYYVFERRYPRLYLARLNGEGTETSHVRLDGAESVEWFSRWVRTYGTTVLATWMERRFNARTGNRTYVVRAQQLAADDF